VLRLEHPLLALAGRLLIAVARVLRRVHLDLAAAEQTAPPLDVLDLVLLEEEGDALRALLRHLARSLPRRGDIQLYVADGDAEIVESALDMAGKVGRLEQRLRRDAPPVVADAAERLRLHASKPHPQPGPPEPPPRCRR